MLRRDKEGAARKSQWGGWAAGAPGGSCWAGTTGTNCMSASHLGHFEEMFRFFSLVSPQRQETLERWFSWNQPGALWTMGLEVQA